MRVVIIGAGGQVGCDTTAALQRGGHEPIAVARVDLDVTDRDAVRQCLERHRPDAVVNCSVFHPVEQCEADPQKSFTVNAVALSTLGAAASEMSAKVLHFSSDFVFDGDSRRPYRESDLPNPKSVFGASKLAGEHLLRISCPRHFILRTSGLYGHVGSRVKRGNFVETMLRLARQNGRVRVVSDIRTSPTSSRNLASQAVALLETDHFGTFHAADHGDYSWYEFANLIFEAADMRPEVEPTYARDIAGMNLRPAYSVLENARLREIGLDRMQSAEAALHEYLSARPSVAAT